MASSYYPFLRALTSSLLCIALFQPCLSQARNGDDYVLVERFQSQLKLAQSGDPTAMYEVARMYQRGRGTEPDMQQALQWYERATAKNQISARAQLGVLYLEGTGVNRDTHKALGLLKPAADKGNASAQYYLGRMYEQGEGLRQDLNQAIYWYEQAAKNGHYLAIDRLKTLEHNRVNASRIQTAAASKPASQTPRADSPALILMRTVLQAKWQHAGRPSGFLPSTITQCRKQNAGVVVCRSGEQQRKTYDAVINYTTDATLSGFNNADVFQVSYVNTVLKVKPVVRPQLDGDATTPRRPPNIPLGKQSATHTLRCEMQSVDRLVCVKDNNVTDTFTRMK